MVEGVNSSMIYVIHCKKFCKCHSAPTPSTTIKAKICAECGRISKETAAGPISPCSPGQRAGGQED
jgi:hypothetical protein